MSSFFTAPASQRKRKRPDSSAAAAAPSSNKRRGVTSTAAQQPPPPQSRGQRKDRRVRDESISEADSEDSDNAARDEYAHDLGSESEQSSGAEDETADERRLRLAQRYLDNIREEVAEDPYAFDAADVDRDLIAQRLREDVAETKGRLHRIVAGNYALGGAERTFFSADQRGVTGVAVVVPFAFTVSGDGSIAKWELASPSSINEKKEDDDDGEEEKKNTKNTNATPRKRPKLLARFRTPRRPSPKYAGHIGPILCLAVPTSGRFLATGGADRRIVIWDVNTLQPLKHFTHHRDKVLSLSFRRGTHTLYSASADRTCKVWSVEGDSPEGWGYVQTLFGHQEGVVGIAGGSGEKFVSVGGRDRTARLFKVVEEQQLVFRGGGGGGGGSSTKDKRKDSANGDVNEEAVVDDTRYAEGSLDTVALIDEDTFVTGSDNGALCLWSTLRKKPVFTIPLAHGADEPLTLEQAYAEQDLNGMETGRTDKKRPGRRKPRWITALATIPLSDINVTGSWDGYLRLWRVTPDRRRIEALGSIGRSSPLHTSLANGQTGEQKPVKGVVNGIAVVERSEKTSVGTNKEGVGLCVVAAVGKEHKLGRWELLSEEGGKGVKNGAVVFEIPRKVVDDGLGEGEMVDEEAEMVDG